MKIGESILLLKMRSFIWNVYILACVKVWNSLPVQQINQSAYLYHINESQEHYFIHQKFYFCVTIRDNFIIFRNESSDATPFSPQIYGYYDCCNSLNYSARIHMQMKQWFVFCLARMSLLQSRYIRSTQRHTILLGTPHTYIR